MLFTGIIGLTIIALGVWLSGLRFNFDKHSNEPPVHIDRIWTIGIALLVTFVLWFMPFFGFVPAGSRGVKLEYGAVSGTVFNEGIYFVTPFINSVVLMDVRTQAYSTKAVESASHDLQTVHTDTTLNYHLDPLRVDNVYQRLGHDFEGRIIAPTVQEEVKATTASYEAEGLITKRTSVKDDIEHRLRGRLEPYGIVVDALNITNFNFSDDFTKAIEAKVTAEQNALKAKNDLVRISTEAEQRVAQARGEAEAIRIQGEALKENSQLVALEAVKHWDGHLPTTMLGEAVPFIDLKPPAK